MANPGSGDKCASAMQQCTRNVGRCAAFLQWPPPPVRKCRIGQSLSACDPLAGGENHSALSAADFLHSERNFLRSLPCRPLASASLEHSSEAAVCTTGAFSAFGAGAAGAAFGAGAV